MNLRAPATLALLLVTALGAGPLAAQGTAEDYERAANINQTLGALIQGQPASPTWIGETDRLWYRVSVTDGNEWRLVDPAVPEQGPLFDHARLANAVSSATGESFGPTELPFVPGNAQFEVEEDLGAILFTRDGQRWRCTLSTYQCAHAEPEEDEEDADPEDAVVSPDGEWEAFIHNYNLAVRPAGGSNNDMTLLSHEGSEGNYYTLRSIRWSPDSRRIAAYRRVPGYERIVHFVRSSPPGQLQPILETTQTLNDPAHEDAWGAHYRKAGDVMDDDQPVLFEVQTGRQVIVDRSLFPDPYNLQFPSWWEDGRAFTFEYNERGHENYRVIEVDAQTGQARALVDEQPETFFNYSGTRWRHDVNDGQEIIWRSERDGWKHLWLYDGHSGQVKHQITSGEFVVRGIDHVDEENRRIYFSASGMDADQDPYFVHHYRINFDGTGLTRYSEADGNHSIEWSPSRDYYVITWSRVDHPHVMELRDASDQRPLLELARTDISELEASGWHAPEPFVAMARDGVTDIWGVIIRPTNFDPNRNYPVIESIYAGPQGSFVPKNFGLQGGMLALAELGFVVVQIDGMGTNNRSKAFHDVAWKDLGDAGFPDRILWHEAVADQYDWYDISRVGIYGGSAGGQNALGALLFHPDFYHVAVAANGCHDNRMDKIWWNELWMGWPLGPHYEASSNMEQAHRLEGDLLLIVGELDTNVDPSSTYQVADALIRAEKDFDLLLLPNGGHGGGGAYGTRRRNDHFVRNLMGVEPPHWNSRLATRADVEEEPELEMELDELSSWMGPPASELLPEGYDW